jgi:hypothetical protein
MLTRDRYVALLEKRAADESSIPPNDSAEATTQEHNRIKEDDRQYLHNTFSKAEEVQSNQTATMKKLFPSLPGHTITSSPLLKVARAVFDEALQNGAIKTASPFYAELAYRSFCDELEKIAAIKPQTLAQVAQKNQIAMSRPAKAWNISNPVAAASSGAKPGSGTSIAPKGILGRLGLK